MNLTALDGEILELLSAGPRPVAALIGKHPRATVYRRVAILRDDGFIARSRRGYILTSVGERAVAEREAQVFTDGLRAVYPPLREMPTHEHAALFELMIAAIALRQHTEQEDRHAGFLIVGPTLRWKSSFAEFVALATGVEGASHITDLRTERGQSLWMRRGATGEVVSQRDLVTAPIAVFDEYQEADAAVRRAVAPFLTGRRRLPLENDIISLTPVPLVLMNPSPGATLAAQTSFTEAQLRRLIPLDVTALTMPDLALTGRRAVVAAREAGPLTVPTPHGPLDAWREAVVQALRDVLTPEGLRLIDVEVMLGLGRGMTAWFRPVIALRQILYNMLLVTETVGWVKRGWVETIRAFPHTARPTFSPAMTTTSAQPLTIDQGVIALFPERAEPRLKGDAMSARESIMPSFALSDAGKADLIWLSRETGRSPDAVISLLVEQYRMLRSEGREFEDLEVIVRLRNTCAAAEVPVAELREYLELKAALSRVGLAVHDVRDAVAVAAALEAAGLSWQDARSVGELLAAFADAEIDLTVLENLRKTAAEYATLGYDVGRLATLATLSRQLEAAGLSPDEMAGHVDHLNALRTLGLDPDGAEALAGALNAAGMNENERGDTLARAVAIGCAEGDRVDLAQETARLARELTSLQDAVSAGKETLASINAEIGTATQERDRMREEIGILDQEGAERYEALRSAEALERLLLGETTLADPLWHKLEQLLTLKRRGRSHPMMSDSDWLTSEIAQDVRRFLERLTARAEPGLAVE
jgi:hypothetical protein